MNKSITILLAFNVVMLLLWRLFSLSNDKIDLFLFYDLEQHLKWYAYYTSIYIRELIQWVIIYLLIPKNNTYLKVLSLALIGMTLMRLIIYWLFNSSINVEIQTACIVLFLILSLVKWQK